MREFEKNIRKVEPYVPGEQPQKKVIKLNTNENPYPPAPGVLAAMKKLEGHVDSLRLYPDPTSDTLVSALADFYHVGKDQVFVGVGSDDVLIKEDYYPENGGVIFPNPNAPTSIYEDLEFVEDIIRHNQDVIVIVDEAYIDFAGESALSLLDKYDNLIITQTFSKARSMAGMRIGYAIASPLLIKYLNDAKYSFNSYTMNKTSLVYGAEAVKDKEYFAETTRKIVETRDWAEEEFKKLGFVFPKPSANFIFVSHPEYDAKELFEAMKAKGIYVRFWGSERIEQYLRVTIGTREEMEALFAFLREYMM